MNTNIINSLLVLGISCGASISVNAQEKPPMVIDTVNTGVNVNPANPQNYPKNTIVGVPIAPRSVTPTPAPTTKPNTVPPTSPGSPDTTPGIPPSPIPRSPNTVPNTTPSGSPTNPSIPKE